VSIPASIDPQGADWDHRREAARRHFVRALPFPPDPFQEEAFDALDAGQSVLVAAPTGSGKTLVASYAVAQALDAGGKTFYTTPLKALSNQKFEELGRAYRPERVGLLTGDISVRPHAPVVVMTTEVLRNMLLAHSTLLDGLHTVVLDEVHYLQDPYRGGVWEEVLVLCPPSVCFVCLSATVSNAGELGAWLRSVRGPTEVVMEARRPITLRHHFAVRRRDELAPAIHPLIADGRLSSDGVRIDQSVRRSPRPPQARRPETGFGRRSTGALVPFRSPRRSELIETLAEHELLPAIVFIFSRAACDDAVRQCLRDGLRLTDRTQRASIRRIVEHRTDALADEDLDVLGYGEWLEGLESGIAAHHAGLIPAYRETVEACFAAGHLKVVFATETLSLGINMPARSVVIERFSKFGGAGRATLTSGEYAQLTGRAGRRGLDAEGHAIVLWSPETTMAEVARVALAPPPDLRSSFRPTYNLAANLVRRFDRDTAEAVLKRSFAQWQATHVHAGHGGRTRGNMLVSLLERRLAVLETLGYVDDWRLTAAGERLASIYHESELLVAEVVASDVLTGAEPSVIAGVLSALVFERRRARRPFGHGRHRAERAGREGQHGGRRHHRTKSGDRLGRRRREELAERLARLSEHAEVIGALEAEHALDRTTMPEPGLAGAVTAWARGAGFADALAVAEGDIGEIAPGDFVRTVKQLADLVSQVALVSPNPQTAEAASSAVDRLVRSVVAAGAPVASATVKPVES
jgi:superfamily II RNA helicase